MDRWEKGMLCRSLAGHDKGRLFVITAVDEAYVYLADGKSRLAGRPKKKKKIHVQLIRKKYEIEHADDVKIKRILKEYSQSGKKEDETTV